MAKGAGHFMFDSLFFHHQLEVVHLPSKMGSSSRLECRRWYDLPAELWLDIYDWATFVPRYPNASMHKNYLRSPKDLFNGAYDSRHVEVSASLTWSAIQVSKKLKVRFTLVCKAWRMLFIQNAYESICIFTFSEIPRLLAVLKGSCTEGTTTGHGRWTKQLTWALGGSESRVFTDAQRNQLGEIISYVPNLEKFAPSPSTQSMPIPFDVLVGRWDSLAIASLTSLHFAGFYDLDILTELLQRATSLTTVELGFSVGTSAIKSFVMPKVKNLSVILSDFGSRYFEGFAGGHYPELQSLSVQIHQGAYRNYDYLNDLLITVGSTLTFLKVSSSASWIKPYDLSWIAKYCPNLEYLAFDIRALSNLSMISKLEHLRSISFEINIPVTRSSPCGVWDNRICAAMSDLFPNLPSSLGIIRVYDISLDLKRIEEAVVWADWCSFKGIRMEVDDGQLMTRTGIEKEQPVRAYEILSD